MHVSVSGVFDGKVSTLEVRPNPMANHTEELLISINWQDRNACNDGIEIYSRSIIIKRSDFKKIAELLA